MLNDFSTFVSVFVKEDTHRGVDIGTWKYDGPKEFAMKLMDEFGSPDYIEKNPETNETESVTFKNIDGFDLVRIVDSNTNKLHPYPAKIYVEGYMYFKVPHDMVGKLKEASPTIMIDELNGYVVGKCASLTIAAATIQFVIDAVNGDAPPTREEYDNRLKSIIDKDKVSPEIPWWENKLNEEITGLDVVEACWQGYRQAGMKKKGKRLVPNCVPEESTSELIKKSQSKRGAPGTLKRKVKGKMTIAKARALKNKPGATTLDKKQANFFINMHSEEATEIPEPTEKQFRKMVKALKKSVKSHEKQHQTIQKVLDKDATNESLKDWFGKGPKGDWVRLDTKGNIKGACAREPGEGKPKCVPRSKAHSMSKKERASATRRKRAADPSVDRPGTGNKPINVRTEEMDYIEEKSKPNNPKLWSRAKSLARSKFDVYPSAYANGWAAKWYKSKGGTWRSAKEETIMNFSDFVAEDDMKGMSVSSGHKRSVKQGAGMTKKGVAAYRRRNPGSKLSTAVTTPPSKLKPGSKAANRRKSFCARSRSWTGPRGKAARRRWNC
jgi:hypothetical protein